MKRIIPILTAVLLIVASPPVSIAAESLPVVPSPVIITEVQTGSASGSDEFIELFNVSEEAVNVTGWQLRYSNATSAGDGTTLIAALKNTDSSPLWLEPGEYYVVHTASVPLSATVKGQVYTAKLSAADKAIGLFSANLEICELEVSDAIAWGASTKGEGPPIQTNGTGDRLLTRVRYATGRYADTNDNAHDFALSAVISAMPVLQLAESATPGEPNTLIVPEPTELAVGSSSSLPGMALDGCILPPEPVPDPIEEPPISPPATEPPAIIEPDPDPAPTPTGPVMPAQNAGLVAPQLTELLPNPAKPSLDATDEYIEMYNSNDRRFELSGFMMEAGRKRYTFPEGTMLEGRSFRAFFSGGTHLSMSNSGGQVRLLDPFGRVISQTDPYSTAKDGLAWALAAGKWQWTTTPSPGAANSIRQPQAKRATRTAKTAAAKAAATLPANVTASRTGSQQEAVDFTEEEASSSRLHPTVLAIGGALAVLYGAYEYRRDVANKLYQLRANRAARRETREGAEGR